MRDARLRPALLWAGAALVLNLAWELAQLRFYAFAASVGPWQLARNVVHCTVGDVLIALTSFAAAALILRDAHWPLRRPWPGLALAIVVGLAWTLHSEWQNVYVAHTWAYAETMPVIGGIGLLPILQWLILPALTLLLVRWWSAGRATRTAHFDPTS
ncbi:MAG: hypothetical protein ACK5TK_05620 [Betaproteobacteria bacterium]